MRASTRAISAAETRGLRQKVLRPRQAPEELEYPGDDAPDSRHVGAYLDGELVGVASVCREPQPGEGEPAAWRLRGMATLPSVRRTGVGRTLLEACSAHAVERGGARLWCNARSAAVEFYRAFGFRTEGEEFELPEIGPHTLMWCPIPRFELRQATEGDREFLFGLHRAALGEYVTRTWGKWDDAWQKRWFDERFDLSLRKLICVDGRAVGLLHVVDREGEVVLAGIEILPECQSRGLGSEVIRSVLTRGARRGVPVTLQVLRVNPARELYERLGFSVTCETPKHFQMTWRQPAQREA